MFRNRFCLSKQGLIIIVLCATVFVFTTSLYAFDPYPFEIAEKGKAREALKEYEDEALKRESEGKLEKAVTAHLDATWLARVAGDYHRAILYGTKAIELSEKGKYPFLQVEALFQTDYEKAVRLLEKAADVVSTSKYEMRGKRVAIDVQIGDIYRKVSDPEEALKYYKKADDYYRTVFETAAETALSRGTDMTETQKEKGPSRRGTGKAHPPGKSRNIEGTKMNFINNLIAMGATYADLNDYESASEFLNKALFYASRFEQMTLKTYLTMGYLYYKKGDYERALEYHKKACQISDIVNIPSYTVGAYSGAAKDYQILKRPEEAVEHYKKAIDSIEDLRSLLQSEEMRSSFFEQMVETYDNMISTLIDLGKPEDAFNFSERARSRTFLDILGSKVDLSREMASALADREREFKARMSVLQIRRNNLEGKDEDEINRQIDELNKEYARFLEKLRREDVEHASLVSVAPLTLKEIQALLSPDKILVEFHVLKDKVVAWAVKKDSVRSVEINKSRKEILDKVRDFRESITNISSEQRVKVLSQELYSTLFRAIDIPKGEGLIIVPHDLLHYLPFESLVTPEGRYLIEDHEISYLSSASLMQFTTDKRKKVGENIIAFGNPDVGDPAYNLIYAEREVKEIAIIYPKSEIYIRKEATKSNAKEKSPGHSVLHFATHSQLNEGNPMKSSLKMAAEAVNDGDFTAEEVFSLNLNASLVVLSACETALGKVSSGDELIGFIRAFIYAGTPSVVTTLWAVDDKSTFLLIQDFYLNMKTMGKGAALRTAQLNVMKNYHHPFFWGAFILTGDPE